MTAITTSMVKELREATGLRIRNVKKPWSEANGASRLLKSRCVSSPAPEGSGSKDYTMLSCHYSVTRWLCRLAVAQPRKQLRASITPIRIDLTASTASQHMEGTGSRATAVCNADCSMLMRHTE